MRGVELSWNKLAKIIAYTLNKTTNQKAPSAFRMGVAHLGAKVFGCSDLTINVFTERS